MLEVVFTSGLEHEPGLEGVHLSAALDRHVAGVVAHVVELVLLKKNYLTNSLTPRLDIDVNMFAVYKCHPLL